MADCSSSVWSAVLLPSCLSKVLMVNTIAGSQLLCSVLGRSGKLKKILFTQKVNCGQVTVQYSGVTDLHSWYLT